MGRIVLRVVVVAAVLALAVAGIYRWRDTQSSGGPVVTGSGHVVSEARQVAGFDAVDLSGAGVVQITQGASDGLTIETDDNILPLIKTTVDGHTLKISVDTSEHDAITPSSLTYDVTVTRLTKLAVHGATQIDAAALTVDKLELDLDGASQVAIADLQGKSLHITTKGGSSFTLSGTIDHQQLDLKGAGDYRALDLASRTAEISIEGTAHVTIRVSEKLNVAIEGAGLVEYAGNPTVRKELKFDGMLRQIPS